MASCTGERVLVASRPANHRPGPLSAIPTRPAHIPSLWFYNSICVPLTFTMRAGFFSVYSWPVRSIFPFSSNFVFTGKPFPGCLRPYCRFFGVYPRFRASIGGRAVRYTRLTPQPTQVHGKDRHDSFRVTQCQPHPPYPSPPVRQCHQVPPVSAHQPRPSPYCCCGDKSRDGGLGELLVMSSGWAEPARNAFSSSPAGERAHARVP